MNLDGLGRDDFEKFSYDDLLELVEELEKVVFQDLTPIQVFEKFDGYLECAFNAKKKIEDEEFTKKLSYWKVYSLQKRIDYLIHSFSLIVNINRITKSRFSELNEKVDKKYKDIEAELIKSEDKISQELEDKQKKILEDLNDKNCKFEKSIEKKVEKVIDEEKKELSQVEHTTLTHVLTLMGIFSAVITIIMSVVLTSTSWLNNADEASAILAFVVPNLVALIAVVALISFIYLYNFRTSEQLDETGTVVKKARLKRKIAHSSLIVILILTILSCTVIFVQTARNNKPHKHYVISSSQYSVIEEKISETESISYYVFTLDGLEYKFEYDESCKHDGNLYYCKDHDELE